MTLYQAEEKARLKRERTRLAIDLAMQSRWAEAIQVNMSILDLFPDDVETHNRLGKALGELGRYAEALEAFNKALAISPHNPIARKNLQRLSLIKDSKSSPKPEQGKLAPQLFMTELGKAGTTNLANLAEKEVLAKTSAGEPVRLRVDSGKLLVEREAGEYLGQVEARLALRLLKLMQGGNRYAAAIASVKEDEVRVLIKETHQAPSQAGKVSFPMRVVEEVRPYIRESLVRTDLEEEEEAFKEYQEEWGEETQQPSKERHATKSEETLFNPENAAPAEDEEENQ